MPKKLTAPKSPKERPQAIVKQMLALATSGFALVAALAWNEVVKAAVDTYIKPYVSKGSGVISLFLYASIITILAVLVTLQLTKLSQTLSRKNH